MTKITVFSGFLGAGKTTLIKKLLSEAFTEKCVLIENEFGEISVDTGFMKSAGVEIREINSGCICCSLVGDFEESLNQVINEYHPERILIEPSGVGKLSDVKKAVSLVCNDEVRIDGCITVVHGKKCKLYARNYGEFFKDQIAAADLIVLSRTQECNEKKLDETMDIVRDLNAQAPVVTTPWEEINGKQIIAALDHVELLSVDEALAEHEHEHHHHHDGECCGHEHHHHHDGECCEHEHHHHHDGECCEHEHHHHHDGECCEHEHHHHHDGECCEHEHHHHHDGECCEHDHEHEHHHHHDGECGCGCGHDHEHHHADEIFGSWGQETTAKFSAERLQEIMDELDEDSKYGMVLRAKGIVMSTTPGEWLHFNYVAGDSSVEKGSADYTGRFCVIGSSLNEENLKKLFGVE